MPLDEGLKALKAGALGGVETQGLWPVKPYDLNPRIMDGRGVQPNFVTYGAVGGSDIFGRVQKGWEDSCISVSVFGA